MAQLQNRVFIKALYLVLFCSMHNASFFFVVVTVSECVAVNSASAHFHVPRDLGGKQGLSKGRTLLISDEQTCNLFIYGRPALGWTWRFLLPTKLHFLVVACFTADYEADLWLLITELWFCDYPLKNCWVLNIGISHLLVFKDSSSSPSKQTFHIKWRAACLILQQKFPYVWSQSR